MTCSKFMNKTQFNDALVSLVEYAAANANHITKNDVEIYFKDILTDERMYAAIYSYLKESKITIDDIDDTDILPLSNPVTDSVPEEDNFVKKDVVESEEELAFIEMYENDIANLSPLTSEEKLSYLVQLEKKEPDAMARLTEEYLPLVQKVALKNKGRGLTLGDLIQEGNIGLLLGISEYDSTTAKTECNLSEDVDNISIFECFIEKEITEAMEDAINMQISSERIGSHLAHRMNHLDDLSRDLSEKLGHAPSVEELAQEMNISPDEVDTIIRTSLNVLSVSQNEDNETNNEIQ